MQPENMPESKIYFVSTCGEERSLFQRLLPECALEFVDSPANVPESARVVSVLFADIIDRSFLAGHPHLRLIVARSTSLDHIDLVACEEAGVVVKNVDDYGENTVAEHVFALLLAITRKLRICYDSVRRGKVAREELRGMDLFGKTLGVVGCGRVGLHVIRLASGFRMRVLGHDQRPHPFHTELLDFSYVDLETLLRESDVITLHVPLNESTRHVINRAALEMCRDGVVFINTARGGLLDMEAVYEGLESGKVGGLGLDVLEDERVFRGGASRILGEQIAERVRVAGDEKGRGGALRLEEIRTVVRNHRLLQHPNVVFTPHTAYNSHEALRRICERSASHVKSFLAKQS